MRRLRPKAEPQTDLQQLVSLSVAIEAAINARREAIVRIMSKPPRERGASTYAIADAIGLSRQQLHQIYRDATGSDPES